MVLGAYARDRIEHEINYTFASASSLGLSEFRIDDDQRHRDYLLPRYSHRLRDNGLDYQANLYLTAGAGLRLDPQEDHWAGLLGLQADYETRRVYTLAAAESILDADGEPLSLLRYRLGFAPYRSGFNELATWLIAEVNYKPYREEDSFSVVPTVRLYYHNVLVEVGVDTKGNVQGTWMLSF